MKRFAPLAFAAASLPFSQLKAGCSEVETDAAAFDTSRAVAEVEVLSADPYQADDGSLRTRFDAVDLNFEACLGAGACLLAKVHQAYPIDQTSNSYHLHVDERRAYLARHQHVFRQFESPRLQGRITVTRGDLAVDTILDRTMLRPYSVNPTGLPEVDAIAVLNPWDRLGLDV